MRTTLPVMHSPHSPHVRQEKTGNQRIEEYLHKKYGRLQIGSCDISRIVLNSHNVVFMGVGMGANS
jgi:hypothetical protein